MENIKINSIVARLDGDKYTIENRIKNQMFGMEAEYRATGYVDSFSGSNLIKGNNIVKKSLFQEEYFIVKLATLTYNNTTTDTILTSNGSKLVDLNPSEMRDFIEVYKIADKALIKLKAR